MYRLRVSDAVAFVCDVMTSSWCRPSGRRDEVKMRTLYAAAVALGEVQVVICVPSILNVALLYPPGPCVAYTEMCVPTKCTVLAESKVRKGWMIWAYRGNYNSYSLCQLLDGAIR